MNQDQISTLQRKYRDLVQMRLILPAIPIRSTTITIVVSKPTVVPRKKCEPWDIVCIAQDKLFRGTPAG
jgi:DNA gyrase inhibitor GyrI